MASTWQPSVHQNWTPFMNFNAFINQQLQLDMCASSWSYRGTSLIWGAFKFLVHFKSVRVLCICRTIIYHRIVITYSTCCFGTYTKKCSLHSNKNTVLSEITVNTWDLYLITKTSTVGSLHIVLLWTLLMTAKSRTNSSFFSSNRATGSIWYSIK